jgi:hypothetical protein
MTKKARKPKATVKVRAVTDERAGLTLPPQVGEVVELWKSPSDRRANKTHGVPAHLDGHTAQVIEVLRDGTFRVALDSCRRLQLLNSKQAALTPTRTPTR